MLELLDQGVCGEEVVTNSRRGHNCTVMQCTDVITGLKSEVEPQLGQVCDMPDLGLKEEDAVVMME